MAKDGDEEMTVVVPPPNSSKLSAEPEKDKDKDTEMDDAEGAEGSEEAVDPKAKAIAGKFVLQRPVTLN